MKYAVITGASSGIGFQTAIALAAKGFSVAICYNTHKKQAEALAATLCTDNNLILCVKIDLCDEQSVKKAFDYIYSCFPRIDVLINNAAIGLIKPLCELSLLEWNKVLSTNLTGAFLTTRAVAEQMYADKGFIINISSVWATKGASCESAYSAAKAGLESFSKSVAKEYAPRIKVLCASVGFADTPINKDLSKEDISQFLRENPDVRQRQAKDVGEDIANLCLDESTESGSVVRLW